MLRRDFSKITLDKAVEKLKRVSDRYDDLYTKCRSQIAQYQRSALEAKVVGNIGMAAKGCFVAPKNLELLREENLKAIEGHLAEAVRLAAVCGLSGGELEEMLRYEMEDGK